MCYELDLQYYTTKQNYTTNQKGGLRLYSLNKKSYIQLKTISDRN